MPSHADHRADVRARILAAAHAQVAEGGWASASMVAVARRAGVATGTLYRHFDSKGALLAEVFTATAARELALIASLVERDGPVRERLAAAVEAFCRRALAAPTLVYALMAEPVDPAVEAARLESKLGYRRVFAQLLREGERRAELPAQDAEVVAAALVGGLQEALISPLAERRGSDALVASLQSFALNAVNAVKEPRHGRRAAQRSVRHP